MIFTTAVFLRATATILFVEYNIIQQLNGMNFYKSRLTT